MSTLRAPISVALLTAFAVAVAGCGPSQEDKDLATERVALYELQFPFLVKAGRDCGKLKEQMMAFDAEHKARIDKFNAAWSALPKERRDKARDAVAGSPKANSDKRIEVLVACGADSMRVQ